jgi:hypothetical protein
MGRREGGRREGGRKGTYLDGNGSAEFQPHPSCDVIAFTPTLGTQRRRGGGRGREGGRRRGGGGRDLDVALVVHMDVGEETRAGKRRVLVIHAIDVCQKDDLRREEGGEGGREGWVRRRIDVPSHANVGDG